MSVPCGRGCCDSFADHVRSLRFNTSIEARQVDRTERRWHKDMPAYRRLRDEGLQPPRIDGCAELEAKADTAQEVESGHALDEITRRKHRSLIEEATG